MKFQKLLSIFVAVLICFIYVPFTTTFAEETEKIDIWDGTVDTSWYNEYNTVFYISTAEELAGLAYLVDQCVTMSKKVIYLKNDIYLNDVSDYENWGTKRPANKFETIGYYSSSDRAFRGSFYGQGHTIYGLYTKGDSDGGLFAYLESGAVVSGVNIMYVYSDYRSYYQDGSYTGGICHENRGTISDCIVYGKIIASEFADNGKIGGICGYNCGTISRCRMRGSVSCCYDYGYIDVGGICGYNGGTISECSNYADIFAMLSKNYEVDVGGICGSSSVTVENCYNRGNVNFENSSSNSEYHGGGIGGGIVGYLSTYKHSTDITNVYNTGIVAKGRGIFGYYSTGYYYYSPNVKNSYDISKGDYETEMKTTSFVESLSDAFTYVEGDYPKLAWEVSENFILGDINSDGRINVTDAVIMQKYLLNLYQYIYDEWKTSDMNNDGIVNIFDMILLKRILIEQ